MYLKGEYSFEIGGFKLDYYLSWIPAIVLFLLAMLFRITHKSWFAPSAFISLIWFFYVCFPLIFASDILVEPLAIWWIVFISVSLGFGCTLGMLIPTKNLKEVTILKLPKAKILIYFFFCMGLVNVYILLKSTGQSFSVFFSLSTLSNAAGDFAYAKYHENLRLPSIYNLIATFSFLGSLFSGMYWGAKKNKLAFLIFIPSILGFMIMTTKGGILYMMVLWLGGLFSVNVLQGKLKFLTFKFITKMTLLMLVLFSFFTLLNMFRYGISLGSNDMNIIFHKLFVYTFGYLGGYSQWFVDKAVYWDSLALGKYTFAGIFNLLGVDRVSGIYTDIYRINNSGDFTNIYTLFRMSIDDFGLFGALFVSFVLGIFLGNSYKKVLIQKSLVHMPILAIFYAQIMYSNISSLLSYNTIIMSILLFVAYLLVAEYGQNKDTSKLLKKGLLKNVNS